MGRGFLRHPDNAALRKALGDGRLDAHDYYRQLLRLVYRLIFLFVTEDRGVLLDPSAPAAARERYIRHYATSHLRTLATRRRGGPHGDQWTRMKLVMERIYGGCPELGIPPFGSFLWQPDAIGSLGQGALTNEDFLSALRMLVEVSDGTVVMPVAWSQIGADELGSVYESLLELHPKIERDAGSFELRTAAGHERKTTGSYYTPTSLVEFLLDSALEPVLDSKCQSVNPEAAILEMRVCDPACGSGHFLVAAARRIARRLAAIRSGDDEPSPEVLRHALRDVVGRCIFGVDLNPMAVELCKISLWLEAVEPGRPLSFLDAHVQTGNSFLGATPALLANGIPDEAFEAIEDDDTEAAKRLKKLNREERKQRSLRFGQSRIAERLNVLAARMEALEHEADNSLRGVEAKTRLWSAFRASNELRVSTTIADAWCSAFVWPKAEGVPERAAVTHDVLDRLMASEELPATEEEIGRLRRRHRFFHWHLAFPHVFAVPQRGEVAENQNAGWSGGFDVLVGNPPWERLKLEEKEFFSSTAPEIAEATSAAVRAKMVAALATSRPELFAQYREAARRANGANQLVRATGRYPYCGHGDINSYGVFAELALTLAARQGRVGLLLPTGFVMDKANAAIFRHLCESRRLVSVRDFENHRGAFFPNVDSRARFSVVTVSGAAQSAPPSFTFFARSVQEAKNPEKMISLSAEDIAAFNPETRTCPSFRSPQDARIALALWRRFPPFGQLRSHITDSDATPAAWAASIPQGLYHQTQDAAILRDAQSLETEGYSLADAGRRVWTRGEERLDPVYEGRMIHIFDHRAASSSISDNRTTFRSGASQDTTRSEYEDPMHEPMPRFWVSPEETNRRLGSYTPQWFVGFKDVTAATNERTMIAAAIPRTGVLYSIRVALLDEPCRPYAACLLATWNSFAFDYACRQATGGNHITDYIIRQLPTPPPSSFEEQCPWDHQVTVARWVVPRAIELACTSNEMAPFAVSNGYPAVSFRWDAERRFVLRAELDAAFFHLYGIARVDVMHVLDSFPIVRRSDEKEHGGDYRTKRVILEVFDQMAEAIQRKGVYRSALSMPPADSSLTHGVPVQASITSTETKFSAQGRRKAGREQ